MGVCIPFVEEQLGPAMGLTRNDRAKAPFVDAGSIPSISTSITVGMPVVPDSQDWYWSETWQSAENQVDADLATGRVETYDTMEEFLDSLVIDNETP